MPTLQHLQRKFGVDPNQKDREKTVLDEDAGELLIVDCRAGRRSTEVIEQKLSSLQVHRLVNRPR